MALFRSNSDRSTLSTMQRKVTKYQKFLNITNVFLLITSTLLIFTAVVLMRFYHIDKLDFWSSYFSVVPIYKILLGVYTFAVAFFGFAISGIEKRILIITYAVLLAIAFAAQLGSIFISLELRTTIEQAGVGAADVQKDLVLYGENPAITAKWDELQRYFHCCGGNNFLTGYNDYRTTPIGQKGNLPDSCCHEQHEGCGRGILRETPEEIRNKVFVNGCLTLLRDKLETDVVQMMVAYACIGVVLGLVELVSIALASAYVAQITRREKRNNQGYHYTKGDKSGNIGTPLDEGTAIM